MQTISSRDAQNSFGNLLDTAQREPVMIRRRGREVAVVLSAAEYARFEALEDALWAVRAKDAAEQGLIGPEETRRTITEILGDKI